MARPPDTNMATRPPFHLAIPVRDIAEAREFYGRGLGFPEGRSAAHWVDFNMYGHQLVVHLNRDSTTSAIHNPVDGDQVPVPHFGIVLDFEEWEALVERITSTISDFLIEPHIRFAGEPGEQGTVFFLDPSGNALEFKAFKNIENQLFAT